MAIDVISRKGHSPLVVGDQSSMLRVIGLFTVGGSTVLRMLSFQEELVDVPLQEKTSENVMDESEVLFASLGPDDGITRSLKGPINRLISSATPIEHPEMKIFSETLVSEEFNLEMVDLKLVGITT